MNKEDQAMHSGLMKLLNDATFPLQAREVSSFAAVYNWAKNDLPKMKRPPERKASK